MSNPNWRKMHDYRGGNNRQECMKCGRVLLAKDQSFPPSRTWTDDKPNCPKRDNRTLRQLLTDRVWYGYAPDSYFYIEFQPYHAAKVKLVDLL